MDEEKKDVFLLIIFAGIIFVVGSYFILRQDPYPRTLGKEQLEIIADRLEKDLNKKFSEDPNIIQLIPDVQDLPTVYGTLSKTASETLINTNIGVEVDVEVDQSKKFIIKIERISGVLLIIVVSFGVPVFYIKINQRIQAILKTESQQSKP